MTQDTPESTPFPPPTVLAIWSRDRQFKFCLGDSITQERTQCECVHLPENADEDDEPIRCKASAWPRFNGPIVGASRFVGEIRIAPTADGSLEAVMQGRYAGVLKLAAGRTLINVVAGRGFEPLTFGL